MQPSKLGLEAKVAALEHELTGGAKRLAVPKPLRARESSRAVALRAELVDSARRVDALERELRLAGVRGSADAVTTRRRRLIRADGDRPSSREPPIPSDAPAADIAAATLRRSDPPVLTDAVDAAAPAVEAVAQLEAEVEYKRQQVAAQLVELRDREQRLRAADQRNRARTPRASRRYAMSSTRAASTAARLERAVIDKDRALEARDARIVTLHEELKQRVGHGDKRRCRRQRFRCRRSSIRRRSGRIPSSPEPDNVIGAGLDLPDG